MKPLYALGPQTNTSSIFWAMGLPSRQDLQATVGIEQYPGRTMCAGDNAFREHESIAATVCALSYARKLTTARTRNNNGADP